MVQATARKEIKWNPKSFNMQDIIDNLASVFDDMSANAAEITALAQRQTWTIVKMFEVQGKHEIMARNKHIRCKVVNAFCVLGDNVEAAVTVKYLGDTLHFTDTENAGKTRSIRLPVIQSIHWKDAVEVEQIGDRKVVYTFTFQSEEEKE